MCVCTCMQFSSSLYSSASPGTPRSLGHSQIGIRQIEAEPQLPINSNHPVVQQLCSAGYTEEQSIDAVMKYGTRDRALKYLISAELEDANENEGIFQTVARSRQEPTLLWRQSSGGARCMEPLDLRML